MEKVMTHSLRFSLSAALALLCLAGTAMAQPEHRPEGPGRPPGHGEAHPGPRGYQPIHEPHGWNARPQHFDRGAYAHNFQAPRTYRIGPYHRPPGWAAHRWVHGEILPRVYWAPEYVIGDYWLFALEVPPPGYEWVRDDDDALLVNTSTGEILQVEYGVFA
jgi:Ni/Co efflux regulator RcnB